MRLFRDGGLRTATSTFTQPLSSELKLSKLTWCLTSTKTIWFIGAGEKKGRREGSMEVGEEKDYIPIATLSPPEMNTALRWAAMRAILMFH